MQQTQACRSNWVSRRRRNHIQGRNCGRSKSSFFFHHPYLLRNVESYPRAVSVRRIMWRRQRARAGFYCRRFSLLFMRKIKAPTWEISRRMSWTTAELFGILARDATRVFPCNKLLTDSFTKMTSSRASFCACPLWLLKFQWVGGRVAAWGTTAGSDNTQQQFAAAHNGLAPAQSVRSSCLKGCVDLVSCVWTINNSEWGFKAVKSKTSWTQQSVRELLGQEKIRQKLIVFLCGGWWKYE